MIKVGDMVRLKKPEDAPEGWSRFAAPDMGFGANSALAKYRETLTRWLELPYLEVTELRGLPYWNVCIVPPALIVATSEPLASYNSGKGIYVDDRMLTIVTEEELRNEIEEEA